MAGADAGHAIDSDGLGGAELDKEYQSLASAQSLRVANKQRRSYREQTQRRDARHLDATFEHIHLFPDERPGIGKAFDGALRDYFY
jgi:hypothetical protein